MQDESPTNRLGSTAKCHVMAKPKPVKEEKTMQTNDLKKGDRIRLRNGWYATIKDNMKGNTRLAEVEGFMTEIGSVYSHDIVTYYPGSDEVIQIEHTPAQIKLRRRVASLGL
jgi:hypothetical protein